MRRLFARMRSSAGQLSMVAALTLVAAVLLTGAPRIANQLTDVALRERIGALPYQVKDLAYGHDSRPGFLPHHAENQLKFQRDTLPVTLRDRISQSWYTVTAAPANTAAFEHGLVGTARLGLRTGSGFTEATRLIAGRWPENIPADLPRLEVAISELNATILNFKVGTDYVIGFPPPETPPLKVRVVGIFAPLDPAGAIWETEPYTLRAYVPQADGESYLAVMLTDVAGMDRAALSGLTLNYEWRYRISLSNVDMVALPGLVQAVLESRRLGIKGAAAETGLDTALTRFADNAKSAQALFAVVQAASLATLGGLILLASGLAVVRRRPEFILLRARGASLRQVGTYVLLENLPILPIAAGLGYYLGTQAPGRPAIVLPLLLGFAALALLALPVLAMGSLRRMSFAEEREDLTTTRAGLKRRTAEISLLVLAGLGVVLLRRRGLPEGIDFYLVTVPVLLATATAIVTLRAVPAPLGWASRLAARARGAVGFLGLARAGRAAPATAGPIAVLVVAVCTSVFSLAIAGTVAAGRERATDHELPADAVLQGFYFMPDTTDELRKVSGVGEVSPMADFPATDVFASKEIGAKKLSQVYVLLIDVPSFVKVARAAGRDIDVPTALASTQRQETPPALISPGLARDLGGAGTAAAILQGRTYGFSVAATVTAFPTVSRAAERFLILPWQGIALQPNHVINPNGFLLSYSGPVDPTALKAAGDSGQLRWISSIGPPRTGYQPRTVLKTWDERRAAIEHTGVNEVLSFTFTVGALGGVLMALLAVGFAVLAGARARGRVLSRLRTMGLTRAQGRRLLMIELAPVVTIAVLVGGAVGVALPQLIAPALHLSSFTDGWDAGPRLDPAVIGGALGLVLAGLGTAVLVETLFNRRMRLGEVLRLGSAE